MAMTYQDERKKQQEQQTQQNQQASMYNVAGTSAATQQQLARSQQGYQPSETVRQAQERIAEIQGRKPQTYTSRYGVALDNILQQIQNPGEFKYEFNGDNQFKYLADLYQNMGRQASLDAQGQAAALTGGYGNSYGANAGAQAYQQYLLGLFDKGMDLQNQAYQRYADQRSDLYNQMGAIQSADETEYARSRDEQGDWERELERAQANMENQRNFEYNQYADALQNAMQIGSLEANSYRADQDEAYRQAQLAEQMRQADQNEAFRQAQLAEQIRGTDLDEAYRQQTFNEQVRQNDLDEAYRQQAFNEQVRQADLDEQYRRDSMAQNQAQFDETTKLDWASLQEKQRQYDSGLSEEQRQFNTRNAIAMCTDMLANGQIPSNDLLVQAGLSYEDAQKLVAQVQTGGGPGPKQKEKSTIEKVADFVTKDGTVKAATGFTAGTIGTYKEVQDMAAAAEDAAKNAKGNDKAIYEELARRYKSIL